MITNKRMGKDRDLLSGETEDFFILTSPEINIENIIPRLRNNFNHAFVILI